MCRRNREKPNVVKDLQNPPYGVKCSRSWMFQHFVHDRIWEAPGSVSSRELKNPSCRWTLLDPCRFSWDGSNLKLLHTDSQINYFDGYYRSIHPKLKCLIWYNGSPCGLGQVKVPKSEPKACQIRSTNRPRSQRSQRHDTTIGTTKAALGRGVSFLIADVIKNRWWMMNPILYWNTLEWSAGKTRSQVVWPPTISAGS